MKLLLVLAAVVLCWINTVCGEACTTNTDCTSTLCDSGSSVVCQHPASSGITLNGGLCTCQESQGDCVFASDCHGDQAPNLSCPDDARHCYDAKCICDRFPIMPGRRAILN